MRLGGADDVPDGAPPLPLGAEPGTRGAITFGFPFETEDATEDEGEAAATSPPLAVNGL